jgi:hypothetical protein
MLRVAVTFLLWASCLFAQAPVIPDTPAGRTLQAWLDAFNSGERERIKDYLAKYEPTGEVDQTLSFRDQTGGFDLLGVDKSEKLRIQFRVKKRQAQPSGLED